MKIKVIKTIFICLGFILVFLSLSSDLLRGRPFLLGWAQIGILFAGGSLILFGLLLENNKFLSFLKISIQRLKNAFFGAGFDHKVGIKIDLVIILLFLIYAVLTFLGRWDNLTPALLISKNGDTGALLSYAAASNMPLNFAGDQVLNPANQATSYNGIYLPYIRFVNSLIGDYGLAFLTMLPLCIFLQLISFYLLGKELFKNRFWAILLSLINAISISYGFWDSWGFNFDPLPRFLFQAIAPFLLLLFLKWREQPLKWFWLMIISSILFFIHVVSTPGIAFMLWVGFFLFIPGSWKFSKKVLFQFLNGLAFAIPFVIFVVLSKSPSGITASASGASYPEIMNYLANNFGAFLSLETSTLLFIQALNSYYIIIPAIIGIIVIYATKSQREFSTNLIITWLTAILFFSLVIPSIEHAIEKSLGVPPVQLDLVRNLRYAIPLIIILVVSGFASLQKILTKFIGVKSFGIILVTLVYFFGCFWFYFVMFKNYTRNQLFGFNFVTQEIKCIANGNFFCPTKKQTAEAGALTFIKNETPIDSKFLSMPNDSLANEIRYAGLRSVAFTAIDENRIAYTDFKKALEIDQIAKEWKDNLDHPESFLSWAEELSCRVGATHWLVDTDYGINLLDKTSGAKRVFENNTFEVIELPKCNN